MTRFRSAFFYSLLFSLRSAYIPILTIGSIPPLLILLLLLLVFTTPAVEGSGNITGHTQDDDDEDEARPKMLVRREEAKDVDFVGFAVWIPERSPKRRITSEVVTMIEIRMSTMMIQV